MNRSVPFFNYQKFFTDTEAELTPILTDVCRRGAFILQKDLAEFEETAAKFVGAKYVIGMANATDALHFAVRGAGIGPGDEVIFCSHTMVASPASVHFAGATPVPVECGPDHLIDPAAVEAAITSKTVAIMPTQLNGRTANMDALQAIADKHGLVIIEDSAQAFGSKFKGKCAGTFGIAGCISFYPAKTLGCFGDGGCLITSDDALYEQVMLLRDHGRDHTGEVVMWGLNSRLDNLQAAILNFKMKTYEQDIARRRRGRSPASYVTSNFATSPHRHCPTSPDAILILPTSSKTNESKSIIAANHKHTCEAKHSVARPMEWKNHSQQLEHGCVGQFTEECSKRCISVP
ncbi:UNVERIFIED_CONTAM: hypothetical protein GTU68_009965 [Idotea baltica]|nr:hypothetical protein [Idotea baltica]